MTQKMFRGGHTPDRSANTYLYRATFDGDAAKVAWQAQVTCNEKRWALDGEIEDGDGLTLGLEPMAVVQAEIHRQIGELDASR